MITRYTQNGLIYEDKNIFKEMHHRNTISWNLLIEMYA